MFFLIYITFLNLSRFEILKFYNDFLWNWFQITKVFWLLWKLTTTVSELLTTMPLTPACGGHQIHFLIQLHKNKIISNRASTEIFVKLKTRSNVNEKKIFFLTFTNLIFYTLIIFESLILWTTVKPKVDRPSAQSTHSGKWAPHGGTSDIEAHCEMAFE